MLKRVHVVVSGRVQNVGFRMFVWRAAEQLHLSGWVQNLPERDQLELEAQGDEASVEALIATVQVGPVAAKVMGVRVEPLEPRVQAQKRFIVR